MQWFKEHLMLTIGLVIAVVVALGYGMTRNTGSEPVIFTETVDSGSPSADVADRELVETLLTLRAITLSGTIFSDPAFQVLQDFGTPIVPEPVGRPNPFAPLNSRASSQSTQSGTQGTPAR